MRIVFPSILAAAALLLLAPVSAIAQGSRAVVPGTGTLIEYASDDFEEAQWDFIHRHPKSSREQDQRLRSPTGRSTNDRWIEGPERGQPDLIKVVPTPPGGLEGSKQALMLRTLNSGIPGYISRDTQQDDIVFNTIKRLRGTIPVGETPSFTVRVYLPPADQWENRTGPALRHPRQRPDGHRQVLGAIEGLLRNKHPQQRGGAVLARHLGPLPEQGRPGRHGGFGLPHHPRQHPRAGRAYEGDPGRAVRLVDLRPVVHAGRFGSLLRQPGRG